MAYTSLAKPGTKHGPCEGECKHIDCAETKRQASVLCPYCLAPLGYDRPLTRAETEVSAGLGHFSCVEGQIEKEMATR